MYNQATISPVLQEASSMRYYRMFPLHRIIQLRHARFPFIFCALLLLANGLSIDRMARILGRQPYDLGWPLGLLISMHMIAVRPAYYRRPLASAPGRIDTHHYGSTLVGRRTRPLAGRYAA
jgi:hypothetical protein